MVGVLTENLAATLLPPKTILKLLDIDLFYRDRKKFQAYYTQCRMVNYSVDRMSPNPFKFVFEIIVY